MASSTCFKHLKWIVAGLCLLLQSVSVAQTATDTVAVLRPVTASYTFEAGSSHLADTYITPLKYSGWAMALTYDRAQAMKFNPERWVMRLVVSAQVDRALNPARNATMWYGGLYSSWGMVHRWRLSQGLSVGAGGSASLTLGCIYSARNGNNPASARAAVTVNATGYACFSTRLWRIPVTLRYQPVLPVTGAFFSPDYGELYYEIYLGNRSNLAHWAWWGNYFALDNLLTADFQLGTTALRLGYRCNLLSTHVNGITSRRILHCAVVGITGEWLSLYPGRGVSPMAKIISANY